MCRTKLILLLFIILLVIVLPGCSQKPPEPTVEALHHNFNWDISSEDYWGIPDYNGKHQLFDSKLQKDIDKLDLYFPLDTDNCVAIYAREILAILQRYGYIPYESEPYISTHFSNGMVAICYQKPDLMYSRKDGGLYVFVDVQSGAVVDITKAFGISIMS